MILTHFLFQAVDARSLAKSRPEFIRTSMLTFFNNCADDLEKTIVNLHEGKWAHLRGTHLKVRDTYITPSISQTKNCMALW